MIVQTCNGLLGGWWSVDGNAWWPNASGNARQRRKARREFVRMCRRTYGRTL